ncbi:hypothetical protein JG687_00011798, partial [Phytophthora cactorum]
VSRGTEADLTPQESQALEPFQLEAAAADPAASSRGSRAWTRARSAEDFATVLLQSRPAPDQVAPRYEPIVAAIPPTSNLCERTNRKFWDANTLMRLDVDDTDDN